MSAECWACHGRDWTLVEGPAGVGLNRCGRCGLIVRTGTVLRKLPPRVGITSTDPKVLQARITIYRQFIQLLKERRSPGKLLDIGCGAGNFLEMARRQGWETEGVEPESEAQRLAEQKGFKVFHGNLRQAALPSDHFDVVTLGDVLDMVEDPVGELEEVFRVLKPGGFLFLRVRHAPVQLWFWKWGCRLHFHPFKTIAIVHHCGFSASALRATLQRHKFVGVQTFNSSLSAGNPYYVGFPGVQKVMATLGSRVWDLGSRLLSILSGGRILMSPSVFAVCRKPHPMPRVLHLITRLDTGGSSENVVISARSGAEAGFDTLVASGPSQHITEEASRGRFQFMVVPALTREIRPFRDFQAFLQIWKLLRAWRPDILHTHSSKAGILGRWAAFFSGDSEMRVIHTPHGHVFYGYSGRIKSGFYVLVERITGWITETFVALSEGEKRESIELGVGTSPQWVVIPSGVRLNGASFNAFEARGQIRKKLGLPQAMLTIGTVARLEPVKGVGTLIEAAPYVLSRVDDEVRFLIVGDGEQFINLKTRSHELGIHEEIIFTGNQRETLPWMVAMDIYVQPSINEGMGKTLVMAESLGLPIIASRVSGIPDVVLDNETGVLVPPGDPEKLAQAILKLIGDAGLRKRMGETGKQWIAKIDDTGYPKFSDNAMAERLKRLYLKGLIALAMCGLFFGSSPVGAVTLKVATHVHSAYSHNGIENLETIADKIHALGIDVFIPTDTLVATVEYGLWPLRNLIKRKIVRRSILSAGPEKYLSDIEKLRKNYPDMLIIPGTEAAAYYRWEGFPWSRLTIFDWNRHMLVLGLEKPEDYCNMPVIGNPQGGQWDLFLLWPIGILILAVSTWFLRRRTLSMLLALLGVLFLWNNWPYRDFPDDPYDAETDWPHYQRLIDYARGKGALAIWAHPDAGNWQNPYQVSSRVFMRTMAYPDAILRTVGHSGFGIFMEGLHQTGVPGGTWDSYLNLYLKGQREAPIWAYAELDYHGPERHLHLNSDMMVVDAKSKTSEAVIEALRNGHFYAVRPDEFSPMILQEWKLSDGVNSAGSGDTLNGSCRPKIKLQIAYEDHAPHPALVQIIRDGKVIFQEQKATPNRWEFEDAENASHHSSYRVLVQGYERTLLATNPIFCLEKI